MIRPVCGSEPGRGQMKKGSRQTESGFFSIQKPLRRRPEGFLQKGEYEIYIKRIIGFGLLFSFDGSYLRGEL